jgi:transposase-like protein
MDEAQGTLPPGEQCLQYLRECRFDGSVSCPHCAATTITRKGTTAKGAQQYHCQGCGSYFNDLTGTVFAGHQLSVEEMFYIIVQMNRRSVVDISRDLTRTYKTVLQFAHEASDSAGEGTLVTNIVEGMEIGPVLARLPSD